MGDLMPTDAPRKKVMIVDNDHEMRELVKKILFSKGFDVIEIENGKDCLTRIHEEKPCLVLLNRRMSDMDGWEVLKRIKGDEQLKSIKVAMLTSVNPSTDDIMREEFDMLDDYVLKPNIGFKGPKKNSRR
jgi:two-component system alkaline phosphatase synthesis response regulator PhoP